MPSPFPGMDPFLEHPSLFPGLHDRFIAYLGEALQGCLPAPYFADINERLWVDTSDRPIGPDVDVLRGEGPGQGHPTEKDASAEMAAGAAQPILITVPLEERRETFLEIRTLLDQGERLVTTIEVLSLTNKTPGPKGRTLYLRKQREILDSDSHLVEIDLLREGTHTTAVPENRLRQMAPAFDYHVCVHSFDQPETFAVYTIRLTDRLPSVAVPLLPRDGAVTIDLQAVLDRCYDAGPYRRRVRHDPSRIVPALSEDQLEWVIQRLRARGMLAASPSAPTVP